MVYIGFRYYYEVNGFLLPIYDYITDENGKLESIIHEDGHEQFVSEGRIKKKPYIKGHK